MRDIITLVENATLNEQAEPFEVWKVRANAALIRVAAICFIADSHTDWIGDSGADDNDLRQWYDEGMSPEDAANWWAEKYDLSVEGMEDEFARHAQNYLAKALPSAS